MTTASARLARLAGVAWLFGFAQFATLGVITGYLFDPGNLIVLFGLYGIWAFALGVALVRRPTRGGVWCSVAFAAVHFALLAVSSGPVRGPVDPISYLGALTDTAAGVASVGALVAVRSARQIAVRRLF